MINLALKSVLYNWRRFFPVIVAVGVSGLMMVVQAALVMGSLSLFAAPVRLSTADLWVGPDGAMALSQSNGFSYHAVTRLWLDPDVLHIEPYNDPVFAMIGENEETGTWATIVGVDVSKDAMIYGHAVPLFMRQQLTEPGTVVLDRIDAQNLGVAAGGSLKINHQKLRVVGLLNGARGLYGVQLIASKVTVRDLSQNIKNDYAAFYTVRLKPGVDTSAVAQRLNEGFPAPEYRAWLPSDLATSTVRYWMSASGAGTLFLASSAIALVITLMVVSQTLSAATASSIREYAALRAYGINFRSVQWVVIKQSFYICLAALVLTSIASILVLIGLKLSGVASSMSPPLAGAVALTLSATVALSSLLAVRRLRHADPMSLLR